MAGGWTTQEPPTPEQARLWRQMFGVVIVLLLLAIAACVLSEVL